MTSKTVFPKEQLRWLLTRLFEFSLQPPLLLEMMGAACKPPIVIHARDSFLFGLRFSYLSACDVTQLFMTRCCADTFTQWLVCSTISPALVRHTEQTLVRRDSFIEARYEIAKFMMIAIKRVESRFVGYSFQGNYVHTSDHASFWWRKDKILQHWYEFQYHFGGHAEYEWPSYQRSSRAATASRRVWRRTCRDSDWQLLRYTMCKGADAYQAFSDVGVILQLRMQHMTQTLLQDTIV